MIPPRATGRRCVSSPAKRNDSVCIRYDVTMRFQMLLQINLRECRKSIALAMKHAIRLVGRFNQIERNL